MKRSNCMALALGALALCLLAEPQIEAADGNERKIDLRVLYAGHPGSAREADFVAFLEKHFAKVGKGDLLKFAGNEAKAFDVVILDYDTPDFPRRKPRLGATYSCPTVTVGFAGGLISLLLELKTAVL